MLRWRSGLGQQGSGHSASGPCLTSGSAALSGGQRCGVTDSRVALSVTLGKPCAVAGSAASAVFDVTQAGYYIVKMRGTEARCGTVSLCAHSCLAWFLTKRMFRHRMTACGLAPTRQRSTPPTTWVSPAPRAPSRLVNDWCLRMRRLRGAFQNLIAPHGSHHLPFQQGVGTAGWAPSAARGVGGRKCTDYTPVRAEKTHFLGRQAQRGPSQPGVVTEPRGIECQPAA